ncbi:hypothetical protein BJY04DRAFT_169746 [Aspergillus karnatakaensis]|uniref:uncharacterized protein n=1 Tax=Aspergillus karnatakaensis TaxID=1810916 RepID=UPI003CCD9D09
MASVHDTSLLCREVERLVTAPYAPSLQDLHSLTQQSPSSVVLAWGAQKACHIGPLVDVLVDGLSRSRYALTLLASFAKIQNFRDDVLQRYPQLLDQFLQQSTQEVEDCLPLCISLLSFPLPDGFTPPASLLVFVMQMIERLKANPCADTVRPLYLISNCFQSSGVLYEMPLQVMSCFQTELTKTLRNLDDHMGNLLCLATFARLAAARTTEEEPMPLQNIRHFFGPKRGLKTLDLVVLRVILACSSNYGNLSAEQSAESIRLGIDICGGVDNTQRERWIEGNSVKIAKLLEKVTRDGIDSSVQMLGISFLVSLIPVATLPPNLIIKSLEFLISGNASVVLDVLPEHVIPRLVEASAAFPELHAIESLLDNVFSTLSTTTIADFTKLRLSQLILTGLRPSATMPRQYGDVIHNLTENFPKRLSQQDCTGAIVCHASTSRLQNDLLSDLVTFWLETLRTEELPIKSIGNIVARSKLLLPQYQCLINQSKPLELRLFPTSKPREIAHVTRADWRAGLREAMLGNSRSLSEDIMQKVEQICFDLEQRCGSIEAPLKVAEEERARQYLEAEQLRKQKCDIEGQLQQASSTILELREEISRLESRTASANDRAERLSASLSETIRELEDLRCSSEDILAGERESFRTRELDMMASLTERDERLDELQEDVRGQLKENECLKENLAFMSKDKESALENVSELKGEILALKTEFEANLEQKEQQLTNEQKIAEKSITELQNKLNEEISGTERLRTDLDAIQKSKDCLEEQQKQYELQCSRLTQEASERTAEIMVLQRAMHEAASNAARETQLKEKRIQHLERKVQNLREERAAKAREFSEAQQHISRLMGVMGFKTASPEDRGLEKPHSRRSFEQSQTLRMQTQTESAVPSREEDILTTSAELTTPRPNGRSPKRSRNSAFRSAQPSSPRSSRSMREAASQESIRARKERKPLGETNNNNQINSQSTEKLSQSRREEFQDSQFHQVEQHQLDDIDLDLDLEFSKDFVFTSTSLSEMNGHVRT